MLGTEEDLTAWFEGELVEETRATRSGCFGANSIGEDGEKSQTFFARVQTSCVLTLQGSYTLPCEV